MNLIKSHKIVTAIILVGIIGSTVGIAVISQPVDNQVPHVSEVIAEPKAEVEPPTPAENINPDITDEPEIASQPTVVEAEPAQPATVADDDMYGVITTTVREAGFERWLTITNVTVLNMLQHHIHGSDTRYTEDELKGMTNKCLAFIENNKQEYLDKYTTMAGQKMALDAQNTPCWLI